MGIAYDGQNYIFNNNLSPALKIHQLRLYASGNGRFMGLLIQK
jgi:hypothetical protein